MNNDIHRRVFGWTVCEDRQEKGKSHASDDVPQ